MKPINQARFLSFIGFHEASVMVARRSIELQLKNLLHKKPPKKGWAKSTQVMRRILIDRGLISIPTANRMQDFYKKASSVAHGSPTTRSRCRHLLAECASIHRLLA